MPNEQRDTRIVEMHFENRQFERNIAKSQKSLEDFKKELNFKETSKGLSKFFSDFDSINFQHLTSNIQALTDKFTGLGDAGEWVLSRIRNGLENAALQLEGFLKSFTTAQISVGQSKYDAMNKAAQALIASGEYTEEQAYSIFERVMEYTDQTSANFQVMVDKLQEFTATGRGLQESERALEGIFNMTSKVGKGAEEASAAMGIFSKAMGQGYISLNNWQSLNTTAKIAGKELRKELIEAAVAVGDLTEKNGKYYTKAEKGNKSVEVSAQNLENTLSKRWATKNTMMALFDKYYFAKLTGATEKELEEFAGVAYKSAQRALTFADAMNAVKESVSSGWMQSFRIIFGDVTDAMKLFTDLCERVIESIYGLQEARNMILNAWSAGGGRQSLIDTVLGDYGKDVETGAYGLLDLFDSIGTIISDGFWNMVKIFARGDEQLLWDKEGYKEAWFGGKLRDISNNIRDFVGSIKSFFTESIDVGGQTKTRLQMIYEIVEGIGGAMAIGYMIMTELFNFLGGIKEDLQPSIDAVTNFFATVGTMVYDTANATEKSGSIRQFFDDLRASLQPLTGAINSVVEKVTDLLLTFITWGKESGFFSSVFGVLSRAFRILGNIINRVAIPVLDFFGDLADIFSVLIKSGFSEEEVSKVGDKIGKAFEKMMTRILGVSSFKELGDKLKGHFGEIFTNLLDLVPEGVKNAFKDLFGLWGDDIQGDNDSFFTRVRKFFTGGFDVIFGSLKKIFGSFKEFNLSTAIKTGFGFGSAYNFLNEVAGWFKGTNLYGVIMAFLGVATIWQLFRLISQLKKVVVNVQWAVGEVAESFKNGFKVRYDDYGEYLMKMAEGIAIFVACIAVLGSLDTSSLVQGLVALALVMGAVLLFNKLLKKDFKADSIGDQLSFAAQLIALGAAITLITLALSILVLAIMPLSKDAGRMATAVLGFAAIMAVIGGFIHLMLTSLTKIAKSISKDGKPGMKEFGALSIVLIALGASISIMAIGISTLLLAITPLALAGWGGMIRAALGFVVILAAFGVFLHLMLKELINWANMLGGYKKVDIGKLTVLLLTLSTSIMMMSAGISALILAITPLALMSWEGFIRAIVGLGLVMLEIAGFIKILQLLSVKDKALSVKIAGLAGLAAGIGLLILALTPFAFMTWEAYIRAIVGLGLVMLEIAGFIKIIQALSANDKSLSVKIAGLTGLAIGLGLLVLAIVPLALMPLEKMVQAIVGMTAVMLVLAVFIQAIKAIGAGDKGFSVKMAGLTGLVISVGILVLALVPLSQMSLEGMVQAIVGLTAIMLVLAVFVEAMKNTKVNFGQFLGFVVLAGSLWLLVQALMPLTTLTFDKMMNGLIAFGGILLILAGFSVIAGMIPNGLGAFVSMLGLALIVVAISFALNEVKNIKWETITAFTTGLATMILAFAGAIAIMAVIPLGAGLKGILLLAAGIAAIAAVLSVVIPMLVGAVGNSLMDFSSKLALIASMLGDFSSRMSGVDEGGIDKASGIFDKLKALMGKLTGFGSYAQDINNFSVALFDLSTGLEIFQNHTKGLMDPAGSNAFKMVDKVLSYSSTLSTFAVGNFPAEVYRLGTGLFAFDYIGSEMSDPSQSKPLALLNQLAAAAPDIAILSSLQTGNLQSSLAGLGGALSLYAAGAKEATGIDPGEMTNTEGAVAILNAIVDSLVKNGGIQIPELPDEQSLGIFGAQLAALASAVVKFSEASNGLGEGTDKAIDLLDFIGGDLKGKLTADNLKVATAFKDAGITPYGLAEFALDIIGLGNAIKAFTDSTAGVTPEGMKTATDALTFFAGLKTVLTAEDAIVGVLNFFTGNSITTDTLTQFGKDIEALGLALKSFATSVTWGEAEEGSFQQALNALDFLASLEGKMPKVGGLVSLFTGQQQTLTELAGQIELLGTALVNFNSKLVDEGGSPIIDQTVMNGAIAALTNIINFLGMMQRKMPKIPGLIQKVFTGQAYNAEQLAKDVGSVKDAFVELGKLSKYISGDDDNGTKIIEADQLKAPLESLDLIMDFTESLGTKMPKVGGFIYDIGKAFTGENYNLSNLQASVTNFKDVCKELATLSGYLIGGEGTEKIIDVDKFNETTGVLDALTTFVLDLSQKMPSVGGLGNVFKTFFTGNNYSLTDLGNDMKGLGEGLGAFSTGLGTGFDPSSVTAAVGVAESIANILVALNSIGDGSYFDVSVYTGAFQDLLSLFNGTHEWGDSSGLAEGIVNLMATVSEAYSKYTVDPTAITAFAAMAQALKEVATIDPSFNFESVGMSIGTGIAVGITKSASSITTAARNAAIAAYNAAMAALNAHSPSRLFMDVGGFVTAGMAIGIDKGAGDVRTSAISMSEEAINGATSVLSIISDLLEEDLDANPTISPVLDLTNMQNGMSAMDRWLAEDRGMSIDTSMAGSMAQRYMPNTTTPEINQNGTDYSGIYERMATLGEQIGALGEQIAKMQIVLDTGAVAGGVAPKVDEYIGDQIFYGERGN